MEALAVAILAFYAVGYFVLGGADIGTGMLLPVLARGRAERRLVVAAIVPFFLTNEVWLLATFGVLVGMFPALEGELLSGLFPLFVAVLAGWVVRDIGVWFRGRVHGDGPGGRSWRASCDVAISAGSWVVAGGWAWIFAGVMAGTTDRPVTEPTVAVAILAVLVLFGSHGMAFAGLRLSGEPRRRTRQWFGMGSEPRAFAFTSAVMAGLVVVIGARLPLVPSIADDGTLEWLVPAVLAITPIVLAGQLWSWRLFGHRITEVGVRTPE